MPTEVAYEADGRLPEPVELAAYFVDVGGADQRRQVRAGAHARACAWRAATAGSWSRSPTTASAAPTPSRGSGLRGLADRVEALDGRLRVDSPPGAGTLVRAELPCGS